MSNIRSFSLFPTLSDSLLSNRFDQMDRLFSQLTGNRPLTSEHPYNLKQINETSYQLTVSVPGYKEEDLNVSLKGGKLYIQGEQSAELVDDSEKWIHQGITQNKFSLEFNLGKNVKIKSAGLTSGLLTLDIEYEIPEEEKPQVIAIENKDIKS
ncbi:MULTISPECIES: Hsp20 family protein [Providencia]|uniref:Hsp20 family protein n=1 Tax=Providencia rettgeri TaxID=587 RepID=A0A3R8WYV0_PRORE|nr:MULTISPECIES: Hsp20 family protein [Providencia]ELR5072789.1 Hsp20 family protein [Providencia stuartii]ELR5216049.1 Hsp20 family protein [Providencia rettgeri]ELR5223026.1 Hsp20 family protein [Providencia rettgeri]MBV2191430.1 Hsp20 family protein [Providencia rettgeri]MDX7323265.1 Hsp20 family protein [Providencia rettgeri]